MLLALAGVLWAPAAAADPAAPTDYRATVRAVEPPVPGLEVRVVGGDAFLWLRNGTGRQVDVNGYQGEPYLRFLADGVVEENQASPTTARNRDRLPASAAVAAEPPDQGAAPFGEPPRWKRVSSDGSYAWHDHRAHWMSPIAPLGRDPGDEILDATVPVEVGGTPVAVRVSVVWERRPPVWGPAALAAGVGAVVGLGGRRWGGARSAPPTLLAASLAALAVGWWERSSLPALAAPTPLRLLGPLLAVLLASAAWRRPRWAPQLTLLAAAQLLVWGWLRRGAVVKAVLPTEAPAWIDRSATVVALVVGSMLAGWTAMALFRAPARPAVPARRAAAPPVTPQSGSGTSTTT